MSGKGCIKLVVEADVVPHFPRSASQHPGMWVAVVYQCIEHPQRRFSFSGAYEPGPLVTAQHISHLRVDQVRRMSAHLRQPLPQRVRCGGLTDQAQH